MKFWHLSGARTATRVPDFQYPNVADELRYGFMQKPVNSTLTLRHGTQDTALRMRHLGSFLPGDG
jgi:gluconate 2-dehydrogenase alpha chain